MSTTARSPQHGDGSRTSARSKISAVHFIRWRDGAGRRAGFWPPFFLLNWPWPPPSEALALRKIASALNSHLKGVGVSPIVSFHARARRRPSAASYGVDVDDCPIAAAW